MAQTARQRETKEGEIRGRSGVSWRLGIGILLGGGMLFFYVLTLAPTVLWGDDALFQRMAYEGVLPTDGGGHWLWWQVARLAVGLPWGDVAYRVNLVSAVAGSLTVVVVAQIGLSRGWSAEAAVVGALSLGVSHTFWTHAVRAEVYTVFLLLMAGQLWLWTLWREGRPWPVLLAALLMGVTILGHQMGVLLWPAWGWLMYQRRHWLGRGGWLAVLGCLLVGMVPLVLVIRAQAMAVEVGGGTAVWRYFTHAGVDFSGAFFDVTPKKIGRDLILWVGFWGLQFVGVAGLVGCWGVWQGKGERWGQSLMIVYVTTVLFAMSYRVNDHYVFFLPSYVVFALFVGWGWQRLPRKWWRWGLIVLLLSGPPLTYYGLARSLAVREMNPLGVRLLPGREPNGFFLWPAKQDAWGAAVYAQDLLAEVAAGGVVLADHTPYQPLRYWQVVMGVRPDVQLIVIEPGADLAALERQWSVVGAVYVADDNPDYYVVGAEYALVREGVVYRLVLRD